MISFEYAQDCEVHARRVMDWRNHPATLQASFDQKPKVWESFREEFRSHYFTLPQLPPLFALLEGRPVGFIRFRPYRDPQATFSRRLCELSINLAPEERGKGLGTQVLMAVEPFVRSQGYEGIIAEIKCEHRASRQCFEKAGYELLGPADKELPSGIRCSILRYERRLIPLPLSPHGVFVIAEAGSNWRMGTPERDWSMAKALVDVAVEAQADAVKFQVYRPETIYVENAGSADYLSDKGMKQEIRSIFEDLSMPYSFIERLAEYCKSQGIHFMASPFSVEDFAQVDPYVDFHKIASYELGHLRLIECAARSGKPLILSTGCATEEEIEWAVQTYRSLGGKSLTLLQCTAKYPAPPESIHVRSIPWLQQRFGTATGLSDHSRDPLLAPLSAVAVGAHVIEKHYTLDNRLPGPDHFFSLTPRELKQMVSAIRSATAMRGEEYKLPLNEEKELRSYARRGIQALCPIDEGAAFEEGKNIAILRPGKQHLGVHPKYIDEMEGKQAKRPIPLGAGIQHGDW